MKIRFLYFAECPNSEPAFERLKQALREEGIPDEIERVEVNDSASALREGFLGSPSIQIDGVDIEASRRGDSPCFGCRVYQTKDGASGVPPMDLIRAALRAANIGDDERSTT